MPRRAFSVQRTALLSAEELTRIEEAMVRILDECGIAVLDEELIERLRREGFRTNGNRVFVEPRLVREFLEAERTRNGDQFGEGPAGIGAAPSPITVYLSQYPQHVHDVSTDRIVPFTTERLIEATKLVDVLSERGVIYSPPGTPADVPPALQPVLQYWVAATYSRHGQHPIDPKAEVSFDYVMQMADALGHPVRHLPVYVFSPLTLGGESLRCVLKLRDRLSGIGVSSMPSAGCTAPIHVGDAFALAAAEVIGSVILLRAVLELDVYWTVGLFPIDLHSMAMVFGSPENFLFQLMGHEVTAYLGGTRWYPAAGNIHTSAQLPGPQACAEKSSLMTAGALLGERRFGSAGTLSLDEVFSAEQLLYDLEIKDHVQRLIDGMDGECDPGRCAEEVAAALEEGTFAGLSSTASAYRDLYWHPRLFGRQFLGAWQRDGGKSIRAQAHAMIRDLIARHDFHLEPALQSELDRILSRARADLGG